MAEMDGKDIEWMKNQIKDIGHDTDEILEDTHMNDGIDYGAIGSEDRPGAVRYDGIIRQG